MNDKDQVVEETTPVLCPICKKNYLNPRMVMNSLSRRDNKTYICDECGTKEAMDDFFGTGKKHYETKDIYHHE
jgi:hypothetical protein